MTLRRQMLLRIAAPTLVIYVAILGVTAYLTYHEAKEARQRQMMQLASSYAARFDGELREAAQIARTTADFIESAGAPSDAEIYAQLERNVSRALPVYGAAIAFEPGTVKPAGELFAPYVCRGEDGRGFRRMNIDASVYDWYRDPRYTWFTGPKLRGQSMWSEPYFDEGAGNALMITYSAPFYPNGKFGGVTTVDIDLPRLQQTVGRSFDQDMRFCILSTDGRFVFDAQSSRILTKTIFDIAKEKNRPELEALGRRMLQGTSGVEAVEGWDVPGRQWVIFTPIRSTKWVFACRFDEGMVLASVRKRAMWNMTGLSITLLLIVACIALVARRIAAPIAQLSDKVAEVGKGDLSVKIEQTSGTTELRDLAASFNRMTSELRAHVDRLAVEQAARARIEFDLDIAREIQIGLLPTEKPNVPGYEFAGWSKPADKTGGDYYDWQTLDDGKTLVSLADVTGHGVGPALVTAVCRAYMRAGFMAGRAFSELVSHLNDLLVADLPDNRFVTCVAALLDPSAQSLEMISAGHGPMFHYRAADRTIVEYDATDIPLGVGSPIGYSPAVRIDLQPGDLFLMLTDGFFEWRRSDDEEFGLDRLRESVIAVGESPIDDLIPKLYGIVQAFACGRPQDDDVTAVVIRRSR